MEGDGLGPAQRETYHRRADVDGVEVFYREAGPRDAPALLLLHGFPTSSRMFRDLIPRLSDAYRSSRRIFPPSVTAGCPTVRSSATPSTTLPM
jgi:hypothetical protein